MSIVEIQRFMNDNGFDHSVAYAQSMIDLFDQVRFSLPLVDCLTLPFLNLSLSMIDLFGKVCHEG